MDELVLGRAVPGRTAIAKAPFYRIRAGRHQFEPQPVPSNTGLTGGCTSAIIAGFWTVETFIANSTQGSQTLELASTKDMPIPGH